MNRGAWIALEMQKRRRTRRMPFLIALSPSSIQWRWSNLNPAHWNIYISFDGVNFQNSRSVDGSVFQYFPDSSSAWTFVVGVDGNGNEITERSNVVHPIEAVNPSNVIVLSSDGHGRLTWTLNFDSPFGFTIYLCSDGVSWGHSLDGTGGGARTADESGFAGYLRICQGDWDGNDILPYSNVVYSDGL